jgi:3-isopropylmalate dehydrogenase
VTRYTLALCPGDGIGPEVVAEAVRALRAVGDLFGYEFATSAYPIGAAALTRFGDPLPGFTRAAVTEANAVLLGAVGDPAFDSSPAELRPEAGLLALRRHLAVYANLRPVTPYPELAAASPLRPELLTGVDLLIVRELTGGLYYGEPRGRDETSAVNTLRYTASEVERVARVAFEAARLRRKRVTSVDKANVLEVSGLWREVVSRVGAEYPDVVLEHLYVDYAAMRLVSQPASFDVLVTENLFGDILSDEAAVLAGSLGVLPSASLGDGPGLFEPVHGSAPGLAGRGVANPIGAIGSAALLLRYGLGLNDAALLLEAAVQTVLRAGFRTRDLVGPGARWLGTREFAEQICQAVRSGATARSPAER